ncbi:MAG: membrane protein insertase YidC [Verrucomicrobia bacterium]|nr:MAG: membrane protein insertase YidC [Verrucomicrobiota bacterium]
MYDRKTWAVLAVCGSLLAVGMYQSNQNAQAKARLERARLEALPPVPTAPGTTPADPSAAPVTPGLVVNVPPAPLEEELVTLATDKVLFTFSNIGGGIKFADFKTEFQVGKKSDLVRVNERGGGPIGGLAGADETLENLSYTYLEAESVPAQKVVYSAKLADGLLVKKSFSLVATGEPGAPYLLDFVLNFENATAGPLNLQKYSIYAGEAAPLYQAEMPDWTGMLWLENNSMNFTKASSFKGSMLSSETSIFNSPAGKKIQYAGVTNQFFATVIRPQDSLETTVWAKPSQIKLKDGALPIKAIRAGLHLPDSLLAATAKKDISYRIFLGPKNNPLLQSMGNSWGELMQYGWFWPVSVTLNRTLNFFHNCLDGIAKKWSWGLAIIFLTIVVRLVIWPLHAKSTRTMKRMSKLQPEMAKLKEKYAEDPGKLNTETMGLYRKYGINPLGGCLPMFIQIPIFFGFYKMLQYAVELRGQGFLWVPDLSQPDTCAVLAGVPINILPVVMAISSFFQIRMTPKTGDAMQQRIIMFMPFMFLFFCYNFASALALYWTTQNIFSIGQTWLMSRIPEPELKPRKDSGKKTWVQRMAEQQAAAQKKRQQGGSGSSSATESQKKRSPRTGG